MGYWHTGEEEGAWRIFIRSNETNEDSVWFDFAEITGYEWSKLQAVFRDLWENPYVAKYGGKERFVTGVNFNIGQTDMYRQSTLGSDMTAVGTTYGFEDTPVYLVVVDLETNYIDTSGGDVVVKLPQIAAAAPVVVHSGATSTTILNIASGNFITNGTWPGDAVVNTTDGSGAVVVEILSATQIRTTPLSGGTSNDYVAADSVTITHLVIPSGRRILLRKTSADTNLASITPYNANTINGGAIVSGTQDGDEAFLESNGVGNWRLLSRLHLHRYLLDAIISDEQFVLFAPHPDRRQYEAAYLCEWKHDGISPEILNGLTHISGVPLTYEFSAVVIADGLIDYMNEDTSDGYNATWNQNGLPIPSYEFTDSNGRIWYTTDSSGNTLKTNGVMWRKRPDS